jgi:hypothetical protein
LRAVKSKKRQAKRGGSSDRKSDRTRQGAGFEALHLGNREFLLE